MTDFFQGASEAQVIWAEIVTPLAEAVGLIDCEQRDFDALEGFEKTLGAEALGRDIDEFPIAVFHPVEPLALLWPAEGRVDHRRGNVSRGEGIDLILHQRDQRRDDDRDAAEAERRYLEAKRLASAGGHHDQAIPAGDDFRNDLFLAVEKTAIAKVFLQRVVRRHQKRFLRQGCVHGVVNRKNCGRGGP